MEINGKSMSPRDLVNKLESLQRQVEEYEKALEFYAFQVQYDEIEDQSCDIVTVMFGDGRGGERARDTLAKYKKEPHEKN